MGKVKLCTGFENRLDTLVLHFRICIDDIGKQLLVFIVNEIAHADDGNHGANFAEYGAEAQTDRRIVIACLVEAFEKFDGNTVGIKLHLRTVQRFKCLSVLAQIIVFRRNRRDTRFDLFNQTRAVLYTLCTVGKHFEYLVFKTGLQTHMGTDDVLPVEVPAENTVQLAVGSIAVTVASRKLHRDFALFCPFNEQFVPIAEVNGGHTVNGFVM